MDIILFLAFPGAVFSSDPRSEKKLAGSYLLNPFDPKVEQQLDYLDSDEYIELQLV